MVKKDNISLRITSAQNARVKQLVALQKPRERRKSGTFVIEGIREVSLAQKSGINLNEVYLCEELFVPDSTYPIRTDGLKVYAITSEIFEKVSYRGHSGGILAVAPTPLQTLDRLPSKINPFYLVIEQVEKPGNIGAVLRTADAAGVDALIICDPATDLYNPNIIRASLGCLFTVPTIICNNEALLTFLTQKHIISFATLPEGEELYMDMNYSGGIAILMGAESTGLSDFWKKNANHQISIPMNGSIDSLNISNAAAIVTYEALRQRNL
jgi:TrmH family RNA methyltransferase